MKTERIIADIHEMELVALALSKQLFPGFVLCLEGDLGAGKTTFTKFLGKGMGITDTINSPTFTILKIYEGELPLYHMDVYRLNGIGADYDLEEYIYRDGVCVIEWYQHIIDSLPIDKLIIEIDILGPSRRRLRIEGTGRYEHIVETLDY